MLKKIKSTHPESQGPFVLIDESDFDPDKHHEYVEGEAEPKKRGRPVKTEEVQQ